MKVKVEFQRSELEFLAKYFLSMKQLKLNDLDMKLYIYHVSDRGLNWSNKLILNPDKRAFKITLKEPESIAIRQFLFHVKLSEGTYEAAVLSSLFLTLDEKLA